MESSRQALSIGMAVCWPIRETSKKNDTVPFYLHPKMGRSSQNLNYVFNIETRLFIAIIVLAVLSEYELRLVR